jgi:hypothetical protein
MVCWCTGSNDSAPQSRKKLISFGIAALFSVLIGICPAWQSAEFAWGLAGFAAKGAVKGGERIIAQIHRDG